MFPDHRLARIRIRRADPIVLAAVDVALRSARRVWSETLDLAAAARGLPPVACMTSATTRLWAAYREQGCPAARARLLETYLGLVYHAARKLGRWPNGAIEFEDLVGAGTVGLVQALEGFDPSRGLAFSTYAMPRIRGAMVDELHAVVGAPRSVRTRRRRLAQAREELEQRLGGPPRPDQMARALGVDPPTYWRWVRDAGQRSILRLDERLRAGGEAETTRLSDLIPDRSAVSPEDALAQDESLHALRMELADVPQRDRLVLTLHYYEGLSLREIGHLLGVTESRVSQIHRQALRRLRARLDAQERR